MKGKNYLPKPEKSYHSFFFLSNEKKGKIKGKSLGAVAGSPQGGFLGLTLSCDRNVAASHAGTAETRTQEESARQQEAMVSTCP